MKKKFILPLVLAIGSLFTLSNQAGVSGNSTAGCSCHGSSSTNTSVQINSDIPSAGYLTGETYNITVLISNSTKSQAGFNLSSSDGTLIAGSTSKLINGEATHSPQQNLSNGAVTFVVQWEAPSTAPTGNIVFSAAGNATNGDGGTTGDEWGLGSLSVSHDETQSIEDVIAASVSLSPSLATSMVSLKSDLKIENPRIMLINGQLIQTQYEETAEGFTVDVSALPAGVYFLNFSHEGKVHTKKFTKM